MSFIRQRKNLVNLIQDLDAFPKVEDDHQEKTASGGGFSLLVFGLILVLVMFEINHYLNEGIQYHYDIDPHFDKKLRLNIDIMVAMKCKNVGADILDMTGQNADRFGQLKEEDVEFDFSPSQQRHFKILQEANGKVKDNYHQLHASFWNRFSSYKTFQSSFYYSKTPGKTNGCRFYGSMEVNKVAGNFHITAGKSISLGNSHMHISFDDDDTVMNFSHRIMHLSFGDVPLVNALDVEERVSNNPNQMWQYFLQVVPTTTSSLFHSSTDAYQYAVTEQNRTISHSRGSHGLPGIYFKYDLSPIRVKMEDGSSTLTQLLVRLCGIVGGVYATSSFIHLVFSGLLNFILCTWWLPDDTQAQKTEKTSLLISNHLPQQPPTLHPVPSDPNIIS